MIRPLIDLQVHWIKTDFNKWKDEDDSDYEDDTGDMDLEAVSLLHKNILLTRPSPPIMCEILKHMNILSHPLPDPPYFLKVLLCFEFALS